MGLGEHAGYIIAGYLISFLVAGGGVVWSLAQGRRVQARLCELEARGIRRRSDKKKSGAAVADQEGKA